MKQRRDVFFAIADENRRAILEMLAREKQPMSVGTIADDFHITRNAVSKHIIVLRESGLVQTEYAGRENYVSLDAERLAQVYQWVSIFEDFWSNKLRKLKHMVEAKQTNKKRK